MPFVEVDMYTILRICLTTHSLTHSPLTLMDLPMYQTLSSQRCTAAQQGIAFTENTH